MRAAVLILALLLAYPASADVPLEPSKWRIQFSEGVPSRPKPLDDGSEGAWFFKFPGKKGHVNYVVVPYRQSLESKVIRMTVRIDMLEGDPRFKYLDHSSSCPAPANVRPYVRSGDMSDEFGRWWSNPINIELQEGFYSIEVPVRPDMWSSVYGKFGDLNQNTLREWRQAMRNPRQVGFTFGGGCFFGHGVRVVKGKARFVLIDYSVLD